MRWLAPIVVVCCVAQAEAAITLEQLTAQHKVMMSSYNAYVAAEASAWEVRKQATEAFDKWQRSRSRGIWYYSMTPPNYVAGDYWTWQAVADQIEYDRLLALWTVKQAEADERWRVFQRELRLCESMSLEYRRQNP